ncbi:nuclease-related domain-containing protein [Bacillus sp. FJAT-50079]|uniref:nuclease-related domain-containing protein n=1 Tax=Bacillus sp. FJAT-50079 TaxID=2833577 RepID=UPI001BCA1D6D|nr:nuclease-related domain-containing protein [Bacillus sp. FJAT-50079]MBS4206740.1 NERD domain-containing protein [Bacillus sp. FJAT-50079]
MKYKTREKSKELEKLEILLQRDPVNDPSRPRIEQQFAKLSAGFRGEQSLDYYIDQLPLPAKEYVIFPGLRLPHSENSYFQIDLLILTLRYYLMFEAKNISGTIFIEPNQMTQTLPDKVKSYQNPIQQVENQQFHLENLMEKHSLFLPGASFVVMTNTSSIIKSNPSYPAAAKKVIRPDTIRTKTEAISKYYQQNMIDRKELLKFARILSKLDTPDDPDVLSKYDVDEASLLKGIQCICCQSFTVRKHRRYWICVKCGAPNEDAHKNALIDYYHLYGPAITKKKCKEFLQLESDSITSKLLRSFDFPTTGERKNRVYHLSLEKLQLL